MKKIIAATLVLSSTSAMAVSNFDSYGDRMDQQTRIMQQQYDLQKKQMQQQQFEQMQIRMQQQQMQLQLEEQQRQQRQQYNQQQFINSLGNLPSNW